MDAAAPTNTAVGLVRVEVADSVRAHVKNDAVLQMAVREVTDALFVFVDASDQHAAVRYVGELYNVAWDLACAADKPQLELTVVSPATSARRWGDLFHLRQLGVVYGDVPAATDETKWLPRDDLLPVLYRPPRAALEGLFTLGTDYFGEGEHSRSTRPVVVVNGTFDRLHNGHRKLLTLAATACSERLVVGVAASRELLDAQPFAELIEPLETRTRKLREFLAMAAPALTVEIVEVSNRLGPAVDSDDIRVLLVASTSDMDRLNEINAWRSTTSLPRQFVRLVRRTDRSTLSSRRIRERIARARQQLEHKETQHHEPLEPLEPPPHAPTP